MEGEGKVGGEKERAGMGEVEEGKVMYSRKGKVRYENKKGYEKKSSHKIATFKLCRPISINRHVQCPGTFH